MSPSDINICIKGPEAEQAATELVGFFETEFNYKPDLLITETRQEQKVDKSLTAVAGLMIAAGSFVINIPGAILSISSLTERIGKKKSYDDLIQLAKELNEQLPDREITLITKTGKVTLHQAKTPDLLDAVDEQ